MEQLRTPRIIHPNTSTHISFAARLLQKDTFFFHIQVLETDTTTTVVIIIPVYFQRCRSTTANGYIAPFLHLDLQTLDILTRSFIA